MGSDDHAAASDHGDPDAPRAPIVVVPFGPPLVAAVAASIRHVKARDALTPVTVVMPSSHAAVAVRRHIARLPDRAGCTGLVNVNWWSLPQVAEALAFTDEVADEERRPPLLPMIRRAALRAELDAAPGRFAAIAGNPTTQHSLERTLTELRDLDDAQLDALAAIGARPRDLVRIHRGVRARCAGYVDEGERYERAVDALHLDDGRAAAARVGIGPVVVVAPRRLTPADERLLAALAERRSLSVLLGLTGDALADAPTLAMAERLSARFGAPPVRTSDPSETSSEESEVVFLRAPDPEEEMRTAVRQVLAAIDDGVRPDDIAIVSRVGVGYDMVAHELLVEAGVPHHAPATLTLAQSVAGRVLLGYFALLASDLRRTVLVRWVRGAPICGRDGRRITSSLDRVARQAGVAGGLAQWQQRLDRLAAVQRRRHGDDDRARRRIEQIEAVRDVVVWLDELRVPPAEASWAAYAHWAEQLLHQLIGGAGKVAGWPDDEQAAFDRVCDVLRALPAIGDVDATVDVERFVAVVTQELDRPAANVGTFGHGVFVGRLHELVGARHELVCVVGMAEGRFPPKGQDDPVLPDAERRRMGGALADRRPSRAEEHRDALAALAAAPRRLLSFSRVDPQGQRETMPSRLFLRLLGEQLERHVGVDDLDLAVVRHSSVFRDVPSFQVGLSTARPAIDGREAMAQALLALHDDQLVAAFVADEGVRKRWPQLCRGVDALVARTEGSFSRWSGWAGPEHTPRFDGDRVGSATSFEQWATCPFRYFLAHVLGVRALDTYADADAISGLDRGSLVHEVLESFIGDNLHRPADAAWTDEDHERVREMLADVAARFEDEGRTGRPLLWQLKLDELARMLETILTADASTRKDRRLQPVAVEYHFGSRDGGPSDVPPMVFELPDDRRVAFRGAIDRIDRDPESGRIIVTDYKTGKSDRYKGLDGDITNRGRHLQLVIYGETARRDAARLAGGDASAAVGSGDVEARYWFVEEKKGTEELGGVIGDDERARFREVLGTIVDGIEQGRFPANPGEMGYFNFAHCGFCEFDRVCPASRDDQWERVRLAGPLADYVALAEPDRVAAESDGSEVPS